MTAPLLLEAQQRPLPALSGRPLEEVLAHEGLVDDLVAAIRAGRADTRDWRDADTPACHVGLYAYLMIGHHAKARLQARGWTLEVKGNQVRYVAPGGFSNRHTTLLFLSGRWDASRRGFRIAPHGPYTRGLVEDQGLPRRRTQDGLFPELEDRSACETVFVMSGVERRETPGGVSETLVVYLAYPQELDEEGTFLWVTDAEQIARVDLGTLEAGPRAA